MAGSAALCVVCGVSVPLSSKRRTLYPPVVSNEEARGFFVKFIANSHVLREVSRPTHACKPCFAKLERGNRQYNATLALISELRDTVRARNIAVSVSDPSVCWPELSGSSGPTVSTPEGRKRGSRERRCCGRIILQSPNCVSDCSLNSRPRERRV